MPKYHTLDKVDRKLLNLLQKDNQIPTRILAEKLHISQPTCLRRIRELREAGIINAEVAMVDPFALGYGMLAFLEISLNNQSDEHMQEFDMDAYYQFVRRVISGSGNVRHFQSRFPMKRAKFATRITFDEKAAEIQVRVPE